MWTAVRCFTEGGEAAGDCAGHVIECVLAAGQARQGGLGGVELGEEAVLLAGETTVVDLDAGLDQARRVQLAVVAQDVVLGGQYHRRGEPGQEDCPQGRSIGVRTGPRSRETEWQSQDQ